MVSLLRCAAGPKQYGVRAQPDSQQRSVANIRPVAIALGDCTGFQPEREGRLALAAREGS